MQRGQRDGAENGSELEQPASAQHQMAPGGWRPAFSRDHGETEEMTQPPNRWEEPAVSTCATCQKGQRLEAEPRSSACAAATTTHLSLPEPGRGFGESSGLGNWLVAGRPQKEREPASSSSEVSPSLALVWGRGAQGAGSGMPWKGSPER